jgi:hypothetical protein
LSILFTRPADPNARDNGYPWSTADTASIWLDQANTAFMIVAHGSGVLMPAAIGPAYIDVTALFWPLRPAPKGTVITIQQD